MRIIQFHARTPSDDDPNPGGGQARPKGGRLIVLAEVDGRSPGPRRFPMPLERPMQEAA